MNLRRLNPENYKPSPEDINKKEEEKKKIARHILKEAILNEFSIDITEENNGRRLEDIGLDSLDYVQLIMAIETKLNIKIADDVVDKVTTIRDAIYYLVKNHSDSLMGM